jgi:pimeloyl-ACP methyl ester carboxylesterase
LTFPVSAHLNVETTFCPHEQWGGFLAQLIAETDLGRPHIVGPDVGTAAALFAAAAHPERMASVIVGTGGAAVPIQLGEPLASWVLDPDLDKYRRMDPRAIVGAAVDKIAGGVPDEIRADYLVCYEGIVSRSRCGMSAGIPKSSPRLLSCCRRSLPRSRSSTAATTE